MSLWGYWRKNSGLVRGFVALSRALCVHLRRQPLHGDHHVTPLRKPAAWKAEDDIRVFDAALAQAHTRRGRIARAARRKQRIGGGEHILSTIGRSFLEGAHRQAILDLG